MKKSFTILFISLLLVHLTSFGQTLEEVSVANGIDHYAQAGHMMGGGIAVFDYNNDGFPDFACNNHTTQSQLYRAVSNDNNWFLICSHHSYRDIIQIIAFQIIL